MKVPMSSGGRFGSSIRGMTVGVLVTTMAVACGDAVPESTESSSAATTVCGQDTVHGMDVSHYDGAINWTTAKANGIDFAIVKATESSTYVDPTFASNWAGMKAAGVVRGAYHFFRANVDPMVQANHVVATVGALGPGDLPITLDLETADGESGATIGANAVTFLDAVTAATGKTAIVYTSPGFVTGTIGSPPARLGHYILWVANWGVSCPNVPAPWTNWAFWQHSATGTVSGVPATAVDLDTFNGTLAQLQTFGGTAPSDAGSVDSGTASDGGGSAHDGGSTGADAGGATDGAATHDDGGSIANADGGSNANGDGGSIANGDAADGTNPTWDCVAQSSGCTSGRRSDAPPAIPIATVLGVIAIGAGRRRRASLERIHRL